MLEKEQKKKETNIEREGEGWKREEEGEEGRRKDERSKDVA